MQAATNINPLLQLIPWFLIIAVFYFILIRPQQKEQEKKQREHKELLEKLQKNDRVVTTGGIHGTVVNVKENTVVIRIDDNSKMEVNKASVAYKKEKESGS